MKKLELNEAIKSFEETKPFKEAQIETIIFSEKTTAMIIETKNLRQLTDNYADLRDLGSAGWEHLRNDFIFKRAISKKYCYSKDECGQMIFERKDR